jgi:protein subunit release factor B
LRNSGNNDLRTEVIYSMSIFGVGEDKERWLKDRLEALGIQEKDIEEKFIRSSGKGGQKVNKTSTCVYLKHVPTGIAVKSMRERSQSLNRFLARRELVKKIEKLSGQVTCEDVKINKAKRQKSKRKKRAFLKYGTGRKGEGTTSFNKSIEELVDQEMGDRDDLDRETSRPGGSEET